MTQNKWPISLGRGHDDVGYEHTFADIAPCDDLHFNDTLTQSLDNQPCTITQSYCLIEVAQQKDWHAHFEFELMIYDIVELQSVQKFHQIQ
jgi:hypothetical protein